MDIRRLIFIVRTFIIANIFRTSTYENLLPLRTYLLFRTCPLRTCLLFVHVTSTYWWNRGAWRSPIMSYNQRLKMFDITNMSNISNIFISFSCFIYFYSIYVMGIHRYHYLSRRSRDDNDIEDDPWNNCFISGNS